MTPQQTAPAPATTRQASARAWVAAHVPPELDLFTDHFNVPIPEPSADQGVALVRIWSPILQTLMVNGLFELAEQACMFVLADSADHPNFILDLAQSLRCQGRNKDSRAVLSRIGPNSLARYEAVLILLEIERDSPRRSSVLDEFQRLVLADPNWSERYHEKLLIELSNSGDEARAFEVFQKWTSQFQVCANKLWSTGVGAMMAGAPQPARLLFGQEWVALSSDPDRFIGEFNGTVPPYTDEIERRLLENIDAAFAIPEKNLTLHEISTSRPFTRTERVLFVSFDHGSTPNDLAEHFAKSAESVGLKIDLWLDTALAWTNQFVGSSKSVDQRFANFCQHIAKTKPDVVILDCLYPIVKRGLNPDKLAALKAQFGFRLVCMFRDSYADVMAKMADWARVANTILSFDPLSPVFDPENLTLSNKSILLPVPANYELFKGNGPGARDQGLVFVGATRWQYRLAILAILMTEPIRFTAVIGAKCRREAATTADYASVLRRAQASLNVSCHGPFIHLVTGRVWESISAHTLLVEQENRATAAFFTKYRHYLPWRNVSDIVHIAQFIDRYPQISNRIANEAHSFLSANYNCERFWSGLLSHVFRTDELEQE